MKKVFIIISIIWLISLTSCNNTEQNTQNYMSNTWTNLNTNQENMTKNQWPVKNGDSIEVNYRGTFEDGTQFDSSYDRWQTLPFTVWAGQMIPWFDAWVVGMMVWEKKTLTLSPAEAYGEYDETKKQVIAKKDLASFTAAGFELKVGEKLPTQYGEFPIVEADDENVTLDVNSPMAGKTLIFEVELVEIK